MNFLARFCLIVWFTLGAMTPGIVAAQTCAAQVGQWLDPVDGKPMAPSALFDRIARRDIVLLGEVHDHPGHHRWQHYAMAALHSRRENMIVGFEMLPRRLQPVLDDWSAGRLDEDTFLERAEWNQVWGYDPDLYLPLLQFAREHRLPGIALNVDRSLVSQVGAQGWDAIDKSARLGLTDPAPASPAYRRDLAELYVFKINMRSHGKPEAESPDLDEVMQSDGFANFVDAQLTWDRAMAEALATAHRLDPEALVIGIVGQGHLEYGFGVSHQLADLGIDDVAVLLPFDAEQDCASLSADLADAVFVVDSRNGSEPEAGPRLGVMIEDDNDGVRIMQVVAGSVAADSGLHEGDVIVQAAGFDTTTTTQLIEIIQRQAPGTWLPLVVRREGRERDVTARFPQEFE